MKFHNFHRLIILVLLIASIGSARAEPSEQDTDETTNVFTLGKIVVTAEKENNQGSVEWVDEQELRQFNRNDLTEALDLMPGVTISRTGARNERTVYVRGFDVKHVPLFMDGIPIYVMYDGYSDFGRFTTFDIAEIELSKGAASVLYGPNTMGGAVNVVTKRPKHPFEADAGIGVAEGDTVTAYANFGTNRGKWYVQGGASYYDRDNLKLSDDFEATATEDGDKRENSYLTDKKFSFKVGFQPSPEDEYALSYSKQEAEKGNPPYTGDDPSQRIRYWQWPQWDKESVYFSGKKGIGEKSYVKTRLYYDKYENSLFGYDDDTYTTQNKRSAFKSWYDDDTFGGSVETGTTFIDRNDLKTALHYKKDRHREHDEGEPERTFEDEYYSIAVEDTITVTDKWTVRVGASYDFQEARKAQDYDGDTDIISDFPTNNASSFNPQVGLFYDVTETDTAYVTIARKSRFPTLKDRYSYRFGTTLPNPDLEPEIAVNYDIGYKGRIERFTFQTAVFYSDIRDYIQFSVIPDPEDPESTLQQNQNIGKVRLYGIEAEVTVRITDDLIGGLGYTHTDWDNRDNDDKLTDIPNDKINAYVRYTMWDKLTLMAEGIHYAGRYSSSDGVRETDDFTIANIKASYALYGGLSMEGGFHNLFDENYEIEEGYPEEGVSGFANLTYRY